MCMGGRISYGKSERTLLIGKSTTPKPALPFFATILPVYAMLSRFWLSAHL